MGVTNHLLTGRASVQSVPSNGSTLPGHFFLLQSLQLDIKTWKVIAFLFKEKCGLLKGIRNFENFMQDSFSCKALEMSDVMD